MANHLGRIKAPVMIGVGAAFDFLAGTKPQAPLWMQRNGLEWLFRLCSEPRRLWRRYVRIVPGFTVLAVGELIRRALRLSEETPPGSPSQK
jgi:N-acetylglucosaminyldiphosphoundecaprenol N-acetyl-beta-D-mannosaminyltransferase